MYKIISISSCLSCSYMLDFDGLSNIHHGHILPSRQMRRAWSGVYSKARQNPLHS